MITYALELVSKKTFSSKLLDKRFENWHQATLLARRVSNDQFWKNNSPFRDMVLDSSTSFTVGVAGGYLRVIQVD